MDNGAKVNEEKLSKRHNENLTIPPQGRKESICPKEQHKQSRSQIDGNGKVNNEVQHIDESPFAFLYI